MWLDIAVFVGTGVLSTLVAQILIYAGAGDPWTCFLPFFNYFGAALVGLLATNRHRPRRNGRRHPTPLALASPPSKVGKVLTPSAKNAGGVLGSVAAVAAFAAAAAERVVGLSSSAPPSASSAGGATASGVDDHGHGSGAGGVGESAGDNTSDDEDSPRGSSSSAGDASGGHAAHAHRAHSPDPLPWLTESRFIAASVALDAVGFLFTVGGIGLAGSALFQVCYSSVVVWAALGSRLLLGSRLNRLQVAGMAVVLLGLATSALSHGGGGGSSRGSGGGGHLGSQAAPATAADSAAATPSALQHLLPEGGAGAGVAATRGGGLEGGLAAASAVEEEEEGDGAPGTAAAAAAAVEGSSGAAAGEGGGGLARLLALGRAALLGGQAQPPPPQQQPWSPWQTHWAAVGTPRAPSRGRMQQQQAPPPPLRLPRAASAVGGGSDDGPPASSAASAPPSWASAHRTALGLALSLAAAMTYSCAYILADVVMHRPHTNAALMASRVGSGVAALFGAYIAVAVLPNLGAVAARIDSAGRLSLGAVAGWYCVVVASNAGHALAYYRLMGQTDSVTTGLMASLRAVGVFIVSALLFCAQQESQCLTMPRAAAAALVVAGVMVYSAGKKAQIAAAAAAAAVAAAAPPGGGGGGPGGVELTGVSAHAVPTADAAAAALAGAAAGLPGGGWTVDIEPAPPMSAAAVVPAAAGTAAAAASPGDGAAH